jgi:NAD(P)-dependent dehydrogenase (short-subunit alcohol dehydrogenase family)
MARKWNAADIPSLRGKLALVTGANRGLGFEISVGLASAGATVIMACREPEKARSAMGKILERSPGARIELIQVDLSELASIRRFAEEFASRFPRLDLLFNNAGAIIQPYRKTADGFELHFGTNHLGTFALTGLLMDRLRASEGARIVNTGSMSYRMTSGLDLDDLEGARRPYKAMDAYGRSKLATLLFTLELARRLGEEKSRILALAAHPGWSNTNPDEGGPLMRLVGSLMAQAPRMGALPALYAGCSDRAANGEYYGPGGFQELRGYPAKASRSPAALDQAAAARLWKLSEELTGVRY